MVLRQVVFSMNDICCSLIYNFIVCISHLHARCAFRPNHVTFGHVHKLQTSLCTNVIHKSGYFNTANKSI